MPSRPDGGVVTQRTANPCTPVRFRLGPPPTFNLLSLRGKSACIGPLPRDFGEESFPGDPVPSASKLQLRTPVSPRKFACTVSPEALGGREYFAGHASDLEQERSVPG